MTMKMVQVDRNLKPVELEVPSRGTGRRQPAGGVVSHTGHIVLNASGSDALREAMRLSNYTGETVALKAGVDDESGLIALYPVAPGAPGSVVCRFPAKRHTTVLHLHSIFTEYPHLKLSARSFCPVALAKDSAEQYCITVALKGVYAADRRVRSTKPSNPEPSAE